MARFRYIPRAVKETSSFALQIQLKFSLNYIRNACNSAKAPVIDNILCIMPEKFVFDILRAVETLARARKKNGGIPDVGTGDIFANGTEDHEKWKELATEHYDECVEFLASNWNESRMSKIADLILSSAKEEERRYSGMVDENDFFHGRVKELSRIFHLDEKELDIFLVIYMSAKHPEFESMCEAASIEMSMPRGDLRYKISNIRKFTGIGETEVRRAISKDGNLMKYAIIDRDLDINRHICDFIEGFHEDALSTQFFSKFKGAAVDISCHSLLKRHADIIANLVKNRSAGESVNILLYGAPGTGKTEFCRSLSKHLGMDLYDINKIENDDRPGQGTRFRFAALRVCQNAIDSSKSIIVVDEADELLNGGNSASLFSIFGVSTRNSEKDIVNDFLDNSGNVCFWITNHAANIEESTRRRFDYSVEFRKFTPAQRRQLWQACIAKHGLGSHFTEEEISALSKKYEINAGGIDIALRNYRRLTKDHPETPDYAQKAAILDSILSPHISLIDGREITASDEPVENYSLEGLNIKGERPISDIIKILGSFSSYLEENQRKPGVRNMNLLLHGPPGTGKTEFAKFAASQLGKPLLVKRGSDLLNMYVGGTEQLIRQAFREAEHGGSILFIDEADGLLAERSSSHRNWEVTKVNELLYWMEQFKGILICATNFKKNLDAASIRRFNLKVEFDYLTPEGKDIFFNLLLKDIGGGELSPEERSLLHKIERLTPGDFKVVRQKNLFIPDSGASNLSLIAELQEEVASRNGSSRNSIGFHMSAVS